VFSIKLFPLETRPQLDRHSEMFFVGIDVGTGSARAALFDAEGSMLRLHVEAISTFASKEGDLEQSSEEIWQKICECVRIVTTGNIAEQVAGIGVCATCSLVALGAGGEPISVSRSGKREQNIILWMDHRAEVEAGVVNKTGNPLLKYVGGSVSLEMQMPKLLWLKNHLPAAYQNAKYFFDLPDFVTFKLTGSNQRSICSAVCKWNFDAEKSKWDDEFLAQIGLEESKPKLGDAFRLPGANLQGGLSESAAKQMKLKPGISVASSMIDAHSGALSLLGCDAGDAYSSLAIICGTSSCHMSITRQPCFASGIWGPYKNAVFEGSYLNEAGQSASGHLLDFILETHAAYPSLKNNLGTKTEIIQYLNKQIKKSGPAFYELTKDFHIWPDFHGNRSPLANPSLKGMISGLRLSADEKSLILLYLGTIQALAYGTKHILDELYRSGREKFERVLICGGLSKNEIFVQTHADVLGIPIGLPETKEAVLLGGAIMGAAASGHYETLEESAQAMGGKARFVQPNPLSFVFHERKYKVFLKMLNDQLEYQRIMNE